MSALPPKSGRIADDETHTREEMRLAGYADSMSEIDVCKE
jgi:hypothetical protein